MRFIEKTKETNLTVGKDWQKAVDKLNLLMKHESKIDPYVLFNIVAPLRKRYYNGDRSSLLYGEILRLEVDSLIKYKGR